MKKLVFIILLCTGSIFAKAFEESLTPYSLSKGNTGTSFAIDSSAILYNPALLVEIRETLFEIDYSNLYNLGAVNYYFSSFIKPFIWRGGLGFGIIYKSIDSSLLLNEFSEYAIYSSYGLNINKFLNCGLSVKYYYANYNFNKSSAISSDFGILLKLNFLNFGIFIKDIISNDLKWYSDNKEEIEPLIRTGLTLNLFENFKISYDIENPLNKNFKNFLGFEFFLFNKTILLNGGLMELYYNKIALNFGFILRTNFFDFKIGFSQHYDLGLNTILGVGIKF